MAGAKKPSVDATTKVTIHLSRLVRMVHLATSHVNNDFTLLADTRLTRITDMDWRLFMTGEYRRTAFHTLIPGLVADDTYFSLLPYAPAMLPVEGIRTVKTGQVALRTTSSATLPINRRFSPRRPCVPITIKSAQQSCATCRISVAGFPSSRRRITPIRPSGTCI